MGTPFVGTEGRVYKDIVLQLERRSSTDLDEWAGAPIDVQEMAKVISRALKSDGIWPSDLFLPGDPADIPFALHFDFTDKWDFAPYSVDLIEKRLGIPMPVDFWEHLGAMTFEMALTAICKRKADSDPVNEG